MKQFCLMAAAALVVSTSLASNLLWLMAFGPRTVGVRRKLRSASGGLRDLVNVSVAAAIARSERQAAFFGLDDISDRDPRDIGACRDHFGLVPSEYDAPAGSAPGPRMECGAGGSR